MNRSFQFYGIPLPPAAMEMESSSSSSVAAAQSESNYMLGFHQIDDHLLCSELLYEFHDFQIPFCQYSAGKFENSSAVNSTYHQSNYQYYCLHGRSALEDDDDDDEEAVLDHHQVQEHELNSCSFGQLPEKVCSKSNNRDVVSAAAAASSSSSGAASRSKQRIKWTQDLHKRFVECVNYLGGAEKATPRAILKLMDSSMLTILHVKSHLQKYRTSKYISEYTQGKSEKSTITNDTLELDMKTGLIQIKEAMQQVNMHLHDQLETQHKLQLLLEEQGRQLKMIFDKQQDSQA